MSKEKDLLYQLCKAILDYPHYDGSGDYDESIGETILSNAGLYSWYVNHYEEISKKEEEQRQKF